MSNLVIRIDHNPILSGSWVGQSGDATAASNAPTPSVYAIIGPPGPQGEPGTISADAGNQLSIGSDSGIYMGLPQLKTAQW